MRLPVAALFLVLLASTAAAQVVDPHELTYGPFEPGPADRSFAIAVAPHGLLLVWSEVDPESRLAVIHTGLLDFHAQLIGPIHKIETEFRGRHATNPAVTTDGTTFFIAWLERDPSMLDARTVAGVLTDGTGAPIGKAFHLGVAVEGAPAVLWDGVGYRMFGDKPYAIAADGVRVLHHEPTPRRVPFATPDANGWVDWYAQTKCPTWCRFPPYTSYLLKWAVVTHEWIRTGAHLEDDYISGAPAVLASENDLLIVWGAPTGLKAMRVIDGENTGVFESRDARGSESAPSIAGSLVVFEKNGDVFGAVITGNSFGEVFPISEGPARDIAPRVYLVGENRYLVTYAREDGPYLAGRFVTSVGVPHS